MTAERGTPRPTRPPLWGWLLVLVVHVLRRITATKVLGLHRVTQAAANGRRVLLAVHHGDLLALAAGALPLHPTILISRSRDGSAGAFLADRLGFPVVRGSSSAGAIAATRALLRARGPMLLAIDGPRGPAGSVRASAGRLAELTDAVVIPVRAGGPGLLLPTWDRHRIPMGRQRIVFGRAIDPAGVAALAAALDRCGRRAAR